MAANQKISDGQMPLDIKKSRSRSVWPWTDEGLDALDWEKVPQLPKFCATPLRPGHSNVATRP